LTVGREAKGYKRLTPEQWAKVAVALTANSGATQEQVARKTGVSRSTVGRVMRARRAPALAG
jgi:transcriptional regulator with XRE-family HTH domain